MPEKFAREEASYPFSEFVAREVALSGAVEYHHARLKKWKECLK
jgi:hypothetical protein